MKLKNYLLIATLFVANNYILLRHFALSYASLFSIDTIKSKSISLISMFKKPVFLKTGFILVILLLNEASYAQTFETFKSRYNAELKGDMLSIGNSILFKDNLSLNDNSLANENVPMKYIDIDSDGNTFNSSSANLSVPSSVSCFRIAYAGLYWGALIKTGDSRTDIDKIKFKLPGSTTYSDITGKIIYDAVVAPIVPDLNKPYACYADVTALLSSLANPQGTYTAANIKSSIGNNGTTGLAAGWTLFVVYEDPATSAKSMTSYDGFSALFDGKTLDIPISGFRTPLTGVLNLKVAFASLNGDKPANGSKMEISNGTANGTSIVTAERPSNSFFNSSITDINGYFTSRVPNGTNSLGYDTGIEQLLNVNKSTVSNGATSAVLTLQVAKGQANPVFSFFNAFAIDIIAPEIKLTKIVKDISGNDIGNTDVVLGQNLYYEIGFQNIGNDDVTKFTLKDVIPQNVIFNYPADITSLPIGVTHTYDASTRTLLFTIPDNLVEIKDVNQIIRLHVQVISDYNQLSVACSNEIKNQAFATYQGVINTKVIKDEGSFSTTVCNFGVPQSTNFLVNIDGHTFTKSEVLCGTNTVLSAANGYNSYSWSTSATGTPVISTNQTYTATSTGTYYVTSTSDCATIKEEITVIPFGNTITNPVIPYADEVVICQNNGKELPNIFLCGADATRLIQSNISDASTIEWEKLNEASCTVITVANCANENSSCTWNVVGIGADFLVNTAGQFRVTLRYPGGCFSRFYFNVYQNLLAPTVTTKDIICTTNGKITIGEVPSGYEYSLDGVTYQPSNVFTITTAGSYTVYIKQVGVTSNPCIFSVPNIPIRQRNFSGSTIVTQPLCNGDKGSIKIAANDADPQYYFSIHQGATLINSSAGPVMGNEYEFADLNPGLYTVRVWTDDGCDYSKDIEIIDPPVLKATAGLTKSLTCADGEITVYPEGGNPPYVYYVNGSTTSSPSISPIVVTNPLPPGGIYNIEVVDSKNCKATTSITVAAIPPPVYTVTETDILCYGYNTGEIKFNVSNSNGYTLTYSIDNGGTYVANPTFSNLPAGDYNAIVKYSLDGSDCFTTAQLITITQPNAALTASAGVSELAGCGPSGEGKIRITNPQGGTAPYEYSFDNQATWSGVDNAYKAPGTYTVYIKDFNGCIYPMPITIDPKPVEPTIAVGNPVFNCDGSASSSVTVTTVPNANYSYEYLLDGAANTNVPSNIFTNLTTGNHTISVKYISATSAISCIPQSDFLINVPSGNAFTASITGASSVKCAGESNGTITIAADNFPAAGFYYSVDGASFIQSATSPVTIIGLSASTHSIRVQYDLSSSPCLFNLSQTITAPTAVTASASITTLPTCTTGATITAVGGGGTPAYQYALYQSDGTTLIIAFNNNPDFTNVPVGSYTVFVRDANACTNATGFPITVNAPPTVTATLDAATDYCYTVANPATLVVNVSGGVGPFTYKLDSNASISSALTTFSFANVNPGTHTILVTDSNNCTSTISNIVIAPAVTFNVSLLQDLTCLVNASIGNPVITGGYGTPYTYTVSYNSVSTTAVASFPYSATLPGTYVFTVSDSKGCPATSNTIVVTPKTTPTHTTVKTDISCNGLDNGTITVTASGGFTSAYTYVLSGPIPTRTQTTNQFTNLPAGDYTVNVIDSKGCPSPPTTVTIANPTAIATNATATAFVCSNTNAPQSATITVVPTGGTGTYTYSYNNGASYGSNSTLTVNDNGTTQTFPIIVRDANGCLSPVQTITLAPLNKPTDLAFINAVITCTATTTTVSVTATNGVGALTFLITGTTSATNPSFFGPVTTTGSAQAASFPNLLPGNYTFRVTDANDCYYTESYTVAPVTPIAIAGNKTSDVLCKGGSTGSGVYTVSGNATVGAYTFVLTSGTLGTLGTLTQTGNTLTVANVVVGTYVVRVTDTATGCFADGTIVIGEPANALSITSATPTNVSCNNDNSTITIVAADGTPNYTYAAVVATTTAPTTYAASNMVVVDTNSATNLSWDVYVKDANGCVTMTNVTIISDPLPGLTVAVDNQCLGSGSTFTITATPTATSLTPVTYGIGGPTGTFQMSPTFSVPAGTYTVSIKDKNGCITAASPIIVYPRLTAAAVVTKTLDCSSAPDAVITTTITGGRAPFTYTVQKGSGAPSVPSTASAAVTFTTSVSNANADTYTFVITDAKGCPTTTATTVSPITDPTVTATQVNVSCNAGSDGSVTLTGAFGSGGYQYSNNATTGFTTNATFGGLTAAGSPYTFYVQDSKGCVGSVVVNITEPANALVAMAVEVPFSCSTTNAKVAGTVTVNVTSGTGTAPYTYSFNGGAFTTNNVLTLNDNGSDQPYTYTVRDARGCTISGSGTLERLNPPTDLTFAPSSLITCLVTAISVQLTASNGVTPLTYTIVSGPVTNTSGATSGNFTGLTPGTYVFRVTDVNGCYYSESYTIAPVTPIVATATKLTDVDCRGNTTGSILYGVSGFATTYSYTVNGGSPVAGIGSTFTLPNLGANTYNVIFTDNTTGCTASTSVVINQPAAVLSASYTTINANCNVPTSSVTVTVAGGTPSFRYSFVTSPSTPGTYGTSNTANLNSTTSTSWYAHIIDANNCTFILPITIAQDPIPNVTIAGSGCLGSGTYTITATGTSGVGTLTYSINGGASYQTGNTFIVTTAGNYTVIVKDANGCTDTDTITVNQQLTLTAVLNKDITCTLPAAAQITLTPTGGSGSFTYTASPATGTFAGAIFTTSTPSNYTFTVTDITTGCTYTTTTAIPVTTPVNPVIDDILLPGNDGVTQTATIKCNGDDTAAIAIAIDNTKGQSPFVFNVQRTAPTTQNYGTQTSGLSAGDYLITVTDAKGCTDTETITISEPLPIVIDFDKEDLLCIGAGISKGKIIINGVTGGTANYDYYVTGINNYYQFIPNNPGSTVVFDVVDFGYYQIRVVDANGCQQTVNDILIASDPDDLDITINTTANCLSGGTALVEVGTNLSSAGPFHFNIYNGPGQIFTADGTLGWQGESSVGSKATTFTGLLPGVTYTFIVYDEITKCYYYEQAVIPIPSNSSLVVANLVPKNITCTGNNDGNVSFDVTNSSGATVDYTYEIFEAFTNVSQYLSATFTVPANTTVNIPNIPINLPVGSYYVYVRETSGPNAGCGNASANFNIQESPVLLVVDATLVKNSNCSELGIISAAASNGTGPYTYQVTTSATPPTATDTNWVAGNTFSRPGSVAGILYYVYAKDAYNCIQSTTETVFADENPTISTPAPICYDGNPFTITISGTVDPAVVGAPTYSINGSAFQSSPSFTFNAAGTYNLVIKDGNGCTANVDYVVYPQLEVTPVLTKVLDCNLPAPNATVTVTATGGTTTYTYTIVSGPIVNTTGTTTGVFTGLDAGNYTFEVNDGACTATTTFTIDPIPATVIAAPVVTNVSCNGGNDGTITINVTSGVGPYEYSLFDGVTSTPFQTDNTFTGLAAGTAYVVTVRNDRDCLQTTSAITVAEPSAVTATAAAATNNNCSPTTVITVSASGGTPAGTLTGYTYNFNSLGFTTDNTFTVNNGPLAVTTTISVRDANNCIFDLVDVTTPALTPPTDLTFVVTTVPTCLATSATVEVTATGGLGALTFEIIEFNNAPTTLYLPQTTAGSAAPASFAGLPPGDYMFQVTDENGCTYQELFTVTPVTPIAIVGALVNDITCNVANGTTNNGSASFTVTGVAATSTYSYTINSGAPVINQTSPTINLTALGAGTYTVTVTDETTLCVSTDDVIITEPAAITFTTAATKVFCSQDISQITVSALSGGTGVYTYAVVAGGATAPLAGAYSNNPVLSVDTDLINLSWDVYVKDANGCIAMQNVIVVSDAPPTIVAPAAQCFEGTALTVDLSTLTTTYKPTKIYTLNGVVLASSTATFTAAGTYVLGIRDDNGCEDFVNYTIEEQVLANAILTKDLYCAGAVNATIEVTITGGVGPYTVQTIFNGTPTGTPATGVTGPVYTVSVATVGTYTFTITDSNAAVCDVTTNAVEVTTPATPSFTPTLTNATCNGDSNGTITVTPTNGVAPYTFDLSGAGSNTTGDANGFYTGLPAGSYTVVITDAKGCTSLAAAAITIAEPVVVSATISVTTALSCGAGNATQSATVTAVGAGGNGSYQYNFNNQGWTTDNFYVTNTAGPVNVLVRDTNLCTVAAAVSTTVDALDPPTDMTFSSTPIYCAPASSTTSTVTITTTDGVAPLAYAILSPASATSNTSGASSGVFTTLAPGDYMFQVTDANGCTYQELYTIADVIRITAAATATTDVTCFGLANGTATFDISNFGGTYSYTFDATPVVAGVNSAQLTFNSLTPTTHTLVLTDEITGCTSTVSVTINEPAAALDFTSTATNTNCTTDMATITVVASGGTVNYKYVAVIAGSSPPIATAYGSSNTLVVDTNGGANMAWDVYVMDANGCFVTKPQTIVLDASPVIASVVATQCPSPTGTYTITVTATGFSAALQYSADGSNYQTGNVITVNAPGTYTISVKDANGCPTTAAPVTIVDPLILTPTVTTSPSCTDGDGVIAVATTGGSGNYEYRIDSGVYPMTTPFTGIASGTHTIFVSDTITGCEVSTTVTLQPATPITGFSLNTTPVTCNGGSDGTITATMDTPADGVNDNPVYTYVLSGITTVTSTSVNRGPQDSPLFSGLEAGTYTVTVTSERGCTDVANITIVEPALIVVPAPTEVQFGCTSGNTANFATITVNGVNGGSGSYLNYEFIKVGTPNTQVQFSSNNVYTEANLLGGSYIVNVYDSKGCIGTTTAPIIIAPYVALDKINVTINQAITCSNLEDITVTATTVGGPATNLEYTLVDVIYDNSTSPSTAIKGSVYSSVPNSTGTFTGLPVGNYLITVKNLDTNCEIQGVHYVNEPNTFDLTIDNVVDVTCFSETNGSANVTFVDRVITTGNPDQAGAFTYNIVDASGISVSSGTSADKGPLAINNLAAGTYTITATLSQSPSCSVSKNFTITGPTAALDIKETHTEITCVSGYNDGTISVTAAGGWSGGYQYQLLLNNAEVVAYSAQTNFSGLPAGDYRINVMDSKGCVDFVDVQLVDPSPIAVTATASTTNLSCFGDTSATITAGIPTGGSGDYLYTLVTTFPDGTTTDNGPQQSNVFNNIGAGIYQVLVSDTWSCSDTSTAIEIKEPTEITPSLVLASGITCNQQAQLTLSATGGTGSYTYSTDAAFTNPSAPFASSVTFPVPVGTYHYYVRDAKDCVSYLSNDIKIDPLETLVINLENPNPLINCTGDNTGVINATAQGGLGNYMYTLTNLATNTIVGPQPTGEFNGLYAGSYSVHVDSGDCPEDVLVTITESLVPLTEQHIVTDVTCNGNNDGKIEISASGGTGIIKYAISPNLNQFFDDGIFDELAPGNYDVIVQDELGCYVKINFDIIEPAPLMAATIAGTVIPEVCSGDKDGAFSIDVAGGTAPYKVSLDDVNGTYTLGAVGQTVFDFTNLSGGTHIVYIQDESTCTYELEVIMPDPVVLNPVAAVSYDCVNNTAANMVIVTVDSSNNSSDVDYSLDGASYQVSNVFTNVIPGTGHYIDVRHTNGCIQRTASFDIVQVDPLALILSDGGLNEIVATATGGGGSYQYTLNGESYGTTNTFIIYKSGDYTVEVTDANGCVASATRYFTYIDVCIPNYFTPNGDGVMDGWAPGCTINYKDLTYDIFDRYGRKIASYRLGEYWDGKYNGNELPSGDYWYVLKLNDLKDAREFVGHFTLYR